MIDQIILKIYEGVNTCTRLFPRSTTYALPEESSVIPVGSLNCPSPEPGVPHFVIKFPLLSNFCMRLFSPKSPTYTLSEESTVIPPGLINWPSPPKPVDPQDVINVPSVVNFWTAVSGLPRSVTYTLSDESVSIAAALVKRPSPKPKTPQDVINVPLVANFCI